MQLEKITAVELGDKVNAKEISPVEVIEYFEKHVEQHNPALNAFVYTKFDEAKEEAKLLEKQILKGLDKPLPLAGVPVGLKDFLPAKKGWTASHGGVKSFITVDQEDGEVYKAFKKLGAIAVGKTNAPSFGFRGTTYNKMYGNTNNPFNTKYNSGGSSGGSCAAVGGLLVPLADAGDGGGSTRIPAAWCNCFGIKPSAGLVPSVCRPDAWTATHPYCCPGPVTKTTLDSAIVLSEMMRYDPADPISVPLPHKNFVMARKAGVKDMKIAVTYDYDLFPSVNPQIKSAVDRTAKLLEDAGAKVEYVHFNFKYNVDRMVQEWLRSISVDSAVDLELMRRKTGFDLIGDHADDLPEQFIKWNDIAFCSTMLDYRRFHEVRTDILDAHVNVFKDYDVILSPVSSCLPVLNTDDTCGPSSPGEDTESLIGFCQTFLQNMTGNPAASVPAGLSNEYLPIGVQLVGKRYFDEDVYKVAGVIEERAPWINYYNNIEACRA